MKFGVLLPHAGHAAGPAALKEIATNAEAMGCSSAWVGDHICFPFEQRSRYPYSDDGAYPVSPDRDFYEPFSTLSYVAAGTTRLSLGVTVVIAPYRPAPLLAKAVGTLSALSDGEVIIGVGAGWLEEEFDALGASFKSRHSDTDDVIRYLRSAAANEGLVAVDPDDGQNRSVYIRPSPPSNLQIWVGGAGPKARRRAGELGDMWHPALRGKSPKTLAHELEEVHEYAETAQRSERIRLSMFIPVRVEAKRDRLPAWEQGELRGPADYIRDVLAEYEDVGVEHVVLSIGGSADRRIATLAALVAR